MASPAASGQATPTSVSAVPTPSIAAATSTLSSSTTASAAKPVKKVANSSTVRVEAQFMVSASDLFDILTNEARIPQWTRAPAQVGDAAANYLDSELTDIPLRLNQSKPEAGGDFSLFGGGVVGKFVTVEKPTSFVQTWKLRSPTWPAGAFNSLPLQSAAGGELN